MFEKISENIYVRPAQHYTDRPNIGLITGEKYTLLFDAGNSEANVEQLREELFRQGLPHPDMVVLSHWHWDHTFGAAFWGVPVIAGGRTHRKLQQVAQWRWNDTAMAERVEKGEDIVFCNEMIKREYPDRSKINVCGADMVFEGEMEIDLGGVKCRLIHARGPHSDDAVICYVPQDRFVFLGDSNGKDLYGKPWHFDIEHEDDFMDETAKIPYDKPLVEKYLELLDGLDFTHCIGGHAEKMTKEELYNMFD